MVTKPIVYETEKSNLTSGQEDKVNHPKHYTNHKWEVYDILEEFLMMTHCYGSVVSIYLDVSIKVINHKT